MPMILTNYVIQKQNANFIQVDAAGRKRHGLLSFFSFSLSFSPTESAANETDELVLGRLSWLQVYRPLLWADHLVHPQPYRLLKPFSKLATIPENARNLGMELGSGSVLGSLLAGGLPPSHLPLNTGPHRRLSTLNTRLGEHS